MHSRGRAWSERPSDTRSRFDRPVVVGFILVLVFGVVFGFALSALFSGSGFVAPWQDRSPKFHTIALGRLAPCQHAKDNPDREGNCKIGAIFRNDGGRGAAIARFSARSHVPNGKDEEVQCSAVIPSVPKGDVAEASCTVFAKTGADLAAPLTVAVIRPSQAQVLGPQ